MPAPSSLLRLALPLVNTHGFTRNALALSVLHLPPPHTHSSPLSHTAISALFGRGTDAERSLINAFLDQGIEHVRTHAQFLSESKGRPPSVKEVLEERLKFNQPVLQHLSAAFALLASSPSISALRLGPFGFPHVDPIPALTHAWRIADEACYLAQDRSAELSWYARRISLAGIYTAAELHQITSPHTASEFLESLLDSSSDLKKSLDEVGLFSSYVFKSWKGILNSKGIL